MTAQGTDSGAEIAQSEGSVQGDEMIVEDASAPDAEPSFDVAVLDQNIDTDVVVPAMDSAPADRVLPPETSIVDVARMESAVSDVVPPDVVVSGDGGVPSCVSSLVAPALGGGNNAIVVYDTMAVPHVLYLDATDFVVRYAWRTGTTWNREVVDAELAAPRTASFAIAGGGVDAMGRVHVGYVRTVRMGLLTQYELRHAVREGGRWSTSVAFRPTIPQAIFQLDAMGVPTFLVRTTAGTDRAPIPQLLLLQRSASTWSTRTVYEDNSPFPVVPDSIWMARDGRNRSWVSFRASSRPNVRVGEPTATGWQFSEAPFTGSFLRFGFAVDAMGSTAHLYATNQYSFGSGAFYTQEMVPGLPSGATPVFALNASGVPTISFGAWTTTGSPPERRIRFVTQQRVSGRWTETASVPFDPGQRVLESAPVNYTPTGFDPAFRPVFLGPYAGNQARLALVEFNGTTQVTGDVDYKEQLANNVSPAYALGSDGTTYLAFAVENTLRIVARDRAGMNRVVATLPSVSRTYALAIGSDQRPRVAMIETRGLVLYRWDGTQWMSSVVVPSSVRLNPSAVALTLDAMDRAHLVYAESSMMLSSRKDVRYAMPDATGWQLSTIETVADTDVLNPSVLLDRMGNPYVGFAVDGMYRLRFARRNAGAWQVADLARDGNGYGFAMYLDAMGRACVAHTEFLNMPYGDHLTLTCLVGNAFERQRTPVDSFGRYIHAASLDAMGRVRVLTASARPDESPTTNFVFSLNTFDGTSWMRSMVGQSAGASSATLVTPRLQSWIDASGAVQVLRFNAEQGRLFLSRCGS